jgi:hypothetical protein
VEVPRIIEVPQLAGQSLPRRVVKKNLDKRMDIDFDAARGSNRLKLIETNRKTSRFDGIPLIEIIFTVMVMHVHSEVWAMRFGIAFNLAIAKSLVTPVC